MAEHVEASPLPQIHRYITTHNDDGKAIVSTAVDESSTWTAAGADTNFFLGYTTVGFPVNLSKDQDIAQYQPFLQTPPGLVIQGGTTLRYVDMKPGTITPMHRTISLDYGVVIAGEIELVLDSGETRVLKVGDSTVQRGTNHAWRNTSKTEWSRMLFVMMEAKPIKTKDGLELGEEWRTIEGEEKSS